LAKFTAVYDSCVLYPAALRDLLVRLGRTGLYRARWTNEIHEEWIRSVLENRPDLSRERLERTRDLMNEYVLDSLVTDHRKHIPAITLVDPDDRHVLAAAIEAQADIIVTFNLRHFPAPTLALLNIEAQHPDAFVESLLDIDESVVCSTLRSQRLDLKNPPKSAEELLDTLETQGLPLTVARLRAKVAVL
jgi:predicted nucleic acid-binding protein